MTPSLLHQTDAWVLTDQNKKKRKRNTQIPPPFCVSCSTGGADVAMKCQPWEKHHPQGERKKKRGEKTLRRHLHGSFSKMLISIHQGSIYTKTLLHKQALIFHSYNYPCKHGTVSTKGFLPHRYARNDPNTVETKAACMCLYNAATKIHHKP